jgi:hypothetical protein
MSAWLPLFANAGIAVLGAAQGADWVHLVGSPQAGIVASVIATLNAVTHLVAGPGPISSGARGASSSA